MIHRFLVALASAAVMAGSCGAAEASCPTASGGEPGAVAQLRGIRFGDDQVSLLFGLRGGATFGVPAHSVDGSAVNVRVRIPNARLRYPDGSASYTGERALRPPGGRIVDVLIEDDGDGVILTLRASGSGCARLASRRYGLGTTHPAALISIALRDGPVVALDPDRGAPGFPMQVVGLGFTPSSPVALHAGGRVLWTASSDAAGRLDTVFYVPDLPPGDQRVIVRDAFGAATAWFRAERP